MINDNIWKYQTKFQESLEKVEQKYLEFIILNLMKTATKVKLLENS